MFARTGTLLFRDFRHTWLGSRRGRIVSPPEPFLRSFITNFSCVRTIGEHCPCVAEEVDSGKVSTSSHHPFLRMPSPQYEQLSIVSSPVPTFHEADSSVVLWHRSRLPTATRLLRALSDPSQPLQRDLYRHIHGDKETYWLAMELANTRFGFSPWRASIISATQSRSNHTQSVCYWAQSSPGRSVAIRGGHAHYLSPARATGAAADTMPQLHFANWWALDGLKTWLNREPPCP